MTKTETKTEARTYSEAETAEVLGTPRSTLAYHRKLGHFAEGVLTERSASAYRGRTTPVAYDADRVDAVKAGTAELYPPLGG